MLSFSGDNNANGALLDAALVSVFQRGTLTTGPTLLGQVESQFSNFATAGVVGISSGSGGFGVVGYASSASGNGPGAQGIANGNGDGVSAHSDGGNGIEASTAAASRAGVFGYSGSRTAPPSERRRAAPTASR